MRQVMYFLIGESNGEKELLLAINKKGFGEENGMGIGGKFNFKKDKIIIEAARRELKKEVG